MSDNAERSAESEPWWAEFVSQYKKVPLRELARRFNTNPRRLRRAAQRCGLEDEPEVIRENVHRLGTAPDPTLADHLGVTPEIIKGARTRRNIPAYDPTKPKPRTSRKSSRRAPPPRPMKPPRVRPDPMLVEVVRRGTAPKDAAPKDAAPKDAAPPVAPPRPELRPPPRLEPAPERRWRGEDFSRGRGELYERPRFDEGEERRRRVTAIRPDDAASTGERRRIIQTSPRSGEAVVRRVAEAPRPAQGARAPATPAAPTPPRRADEDFEEYARRRIQESGRRLAEAMEEIEGEPTRDGPRPRRRIVSVERLEELREARPDEALPKAPAPKAPTPEPDAPPPRAKRVRPAPPLPVRTLFDKDQGSPPPAELLRDLPPPPEPMISEHVVAHRPAVMPPHVAAEPTPAPVHAKPIVPLRYWQAILADGRLLVIAAGDITDAARLAQPHGDIHRLEPADLLS